MAEFRGVPLWEDGRPKGGALLPLSEKAPRDAATEIHGALVDVQAGSKSVVVRGVAGESLDAVLSSAVAHANQALDLLAVRGAASLTLHDVEADNVVWVEQATRVHLRTMGVGTLPMDKPGIRALVRDQDGNDVPQPVPPEPAWHESFRYFRLAQTTDDLHNAFRNLYLAVESILSTLAPQKVRANGKPAEREGEWFRRALDAASLHVELKRFTVSGDADTAAVDLFHEMYEKSRTAVFHAKEGRRVILPLDEPTRLTLTGSLRRLSQFYVELAAGVLGAGYASGGWFTRGFHMLAQGLLEGGSIYISDKPGTFNLDADTVPDIGPDMISLATRHAPELEERFTAFIVGEAEVAAEMNAGRRGIIQAVALASDGQPRFGWTQEDGLLTLDGVDTLSVAMGLRGLNVAMLKTRYWG